MLRAARNGSMFITATDGLVSAYGSVGVQMSVDGGGTRERR